MTANPRVLYSVDGARYVLEDWILAMQAGVAARRHPTRGWPRAIGPTSASAYLSGLESLNLRGADPGASPGDWHREGTWWTQWFTAADGRPYTATLWGPEGRWPGAPVKKALRDARPGLAALEHPEGQSATPIWCTTLPHATVDLAWHAIARGSDPPGVREIERWLNEAERTEAVRVAERAGAAARDHDQRQRWEQWRRDALEPDTARGHAARPAPAMGL